MWGKKLCGCYCFSVNSVPYVHLMWFRNVKRYNKQRCLGLPVRGWGLDGTGKRCPEWDAEPGANAQTVTRSVDNSSGEVSLSLFYGWGNGSSKISNLSKVPVAGWIFWETNSETELSTWDTYEERLLESCLRSGRQEDSRIGQRGNWTGAVTVKGSVDPMGAW